MSATATDTFIYVATYSDKEAAKRGLLKASQVSISTTIDPVDIT